MSHHLNCWANNIWAQYCNWKLMDWLFIVHKCWHRSTYNHFSRDEIKTSKHLKCYEFGTNDLSGKTTYKLMTTFLAVLFLRPRENNQEPLNLNCRVILSNCQHHASSRILYPWKLMIYQELWIMKTHVFFLEPDSVIS